MSWASVLRDALIDLNHEFWLENNRVEYETRSVQVAHPYREAVPPDPRVVQEPRDTTTPEYLPLDRYQVWTSRPSNYDADATIKLLQGILCPRCKTMVWRGDIEQSRTIGCKICGLQIKRLGACLSVSGVDVRAR